MQSNEHITPGLNSSSGIFLSVLAGPVAIVIGDAFLDDRVLAD
jgi:hypothetical protein